jgi:ABC-2 type transport system permease protein
MNDLIAVEWLKLRTTHLLHGMVPATLALSFAAVAGRILSAEDATTLTSTEGVREVLSLTGTGAAMVLIVGIIVASGEHRHGTAADTFLTTPRRHQVVTAKLTFGALLGLAAGVLSSLASVGLAVVLYEAEGVTFPLGDSDVWLTLAGALAYTTFFAVLGVALGALARNQTLAISIALAWLAVVEHTLVGLVPDVGRWMPAAAGQAIVRTPMGDLLSPAVATAVLAAYTAALALAGVRATTTRDV